MQRIAEENIGGAYVRRRFESAGRIFLAGEELARDFLLRMPRGNRDAMSDSKQIEIFPKSAVAATAKPSSKGGELHLRAAGIGTYDVIQGTIVGTGLTKEAAQAMVDQATAQPVSEQAPKVEAAKKARKPKKARKAKKRTTRGGGSSQRVAEAAAAQPSPARADTDDANGPID